MPVYCPEVFFTCALKVLPGVNLGRTVSSMVKVSPVAGLRPCRALAITVSKLPKPVKATFSPEATAVPEATVTPEATVQAEATASEGTALPAETPGADIAQVETTQSAEADQTSD